MPLLLLAALPLLLFPLLELYLLIQVGDWIGALPTLLLCLGTAVAGVYLVRLQGFAVLRRLSGALGQGAPVAEELLEGALLLLAGCCCCCSRGCSRMAWDCCSWSHPMRRLLIQGVRRRFRVQEVQVREASGPGPHRVIEGEYERERP